MGTGDGDPEYGHGLANAYRANQRPEGDINNDNFTNAHDAIMFGVRFGTDSSSANWNRIADLNIDNYINAKDAVILGDHFGWSSDTVKGQQLGMLSSFGTKLKVQPTTNKFYTDTTGVGQNFTVSVVCENVIDLYGWELKLSWTPGLINCSAVAVNSNLWSNYLGPWMSNPINNTRGEFYQSLTARAPSSSFNGTIWLTNLTFTIVQAPQEGGMLTTNLALSAGPGNTYSLFNSNATDIPHDFVQGSYSYISARYMRSDLWTINGLQAYKLNTTESGTTQTVNVTEYKSNTAYWGIRVWKRASNGTETEVTSGTPAAQVYRTQNGYGIQSGTWNCTNVTLATTDSVVVRAYCMNGGDWVLQASFTTNQLNATRLNAGTWTVYYYTQRTYQILQGIGRTIAYFKWGSTGYNSRIEGMTATT